MNDRQLIERITYMASLVSNQKDIDIILDGLRRVTASLPANTPPEALQLSAADRSILEDVARQIETYLIKKDPVRSFTPETLQQNVRHHFEGVKASSVWRRPLWALVVVLAGSVLLGLLPFIIPNNIDQALRPQLALALFFFGTHNGNIWFFLSALKNFTSQLRTAFAYVAVGILLVGIVGAQFTILNLFNMQDSPWGRYGGFLFLMPFAYIFLYIGMRLFGKQLGIQSWLLSLRWFTGITLLLPFALLLLVPYVDVPSGERPYYAATLIGATVAALMIGWIARLIWLISRNLTTIYAKGMRLLAISFGLAFGIIVSMVGAILVLKKLDASVLAVTSLPFLVAEPLELLAGYIFKKRVSA